MTENKMFEKYNHHAREVWVNSELKGKHKEYCLCWDCIKLNPDDRELNCTIANLLFAVDCAVGITTPVFECPEFKEKIE
jgi:hypothetical protein